MTAAVNTRIAAYRWSQWLRSPSDLAAYEYLCSEGSFEVLTRKLERLIWRHRTRVFDAGAGDAHRRAILRLKRTVTYRAHCWERYYAGLVRAGDRLTRMGY